MKFADDKYLCDLGIKKNVLDNTQETLIIKGNFFKRLKKRVKFCLPSASRAQVPSYAHSILSDYLATVQGDFSRS